jgi:hypothetical protein
MQKAGAGVIFHAQEDLPASDLERSVPTPTFSLSLTFSNPLLARTFPPFRQTFMLRDVHFPASVQSSGPG